MMYLEVQNANQLEVFVSSWLLPLLRTAGGHILRALSSLAIMLLGPTVLGWILVGLARQLGRVVRWKYYHELVERIALAWGVK